MKFEVITNIDGNNNSVLSFDQDKKPKKEFEKAANLVKALDKMYQYGLYF